MKFSIASILGPKNLKVLDYDIARLDSNVDDIMHNTT